MHEYSIGLIKRHGMITQGRMLKAGTRPVRKAHTCNLDRTVPFSLMFSASYYPILKEWN